MPTAQVSLPQCPGAVIVLTRPPPSSSRKMTEPAFLAEPGSSRRSTFRPWAANSFLYRAGSATGSFTFTVRYPPFRVKESAAVCTRGGAGATVTAGRPVSRTGTTVTATATAAAPAATAPVVSSSHGRAGRRRVLVTRAGRGLATMAAILASIPASDWSVSDRSSRATGLRADRTR